MTSFRTSLLLSLTALTLLVLPHSATLPDPAQPQDLAQPQDATAQPQDPAHTQELSATLAHGALSVTIPYTADRRAPGKLLLEILDPADHVLGRSEHAMDTIHGPGTWHQDVTPAQPLPFEELVWERLRYRFVYTGEQTAAFEDTVAISEVLRRPVVHLLGQTAYLTGARAAMRLIVTDTNNQPLTAGSVRLELLAPQPDAQAAAAKDAQPQPPARLLFTGHLDKRGTVGAGFAFPSGLTGTFDLHIVAETPIGVTEATQTIRLEDKASILLTTEKPIYQPGQTIHVRALALERADHRATANRPLTFKLEDSHGNKVFKKITSTDAFGIASAEFALADEVNLGVYHLRALLADPQASSSNAAPAQSTELALDVERYVLPKFKVSVDFTPAGAKPGAKPRRDFRPGDHVTGTVQAMYFFGKPVNDAAITLKASSLDVALFDIAALTGRTDKDGVFHFDVKLPSFFAGRPLSQGAARVLLEASVKDAAGHTETRGEPITVSPSDMLVTAIPEGGQLIPGLDNRVYLLTSYPDGTPAATRITARLGNTQDQHLTTGSDGIAILHARPGSGLDLLKAHPGADATTVHIDADDLHGARVTTSVPLQTRTMGDQLLLRADRSVYRAGDRIDLQVLSTQPRGSAYIDIVKDGQTILTRDLDLADGHAELSLTATPEMSGALDLNAYLFGRDAQALGDHRLVFVQPATELHIDTVADAATYKPGAEARLHFHVTDGHGVGVRAALGLQIVDEAVFALAEKQPGFAKVFFYLEQEAMKPRFEIHSVSLGEVVAPPSAQPQTQPNLDADAQRDLAAAALFAATDIPAPNRLTTEFGRTLPDAKAAEFTQRYQASLNDQVPTLSARLRETSLQNPGVTDPVQLFTRLTNTDGSRPHDPWGGVLRLEPVEWSSGPDRRYTLRSAGPDRQLNTADDLSVDLLFHAAALRNATLLPASGRSSITVKLEHDRGPAGDRAAITGTVTDPITAVISGATIEARNLDTGVTRHASADTSGAFTFNALPAGRYRLLVTSPGFDAGFRDLTLQPRDRAVISAMLNVGSVSEAVNVKAATLEIAPAPEMLFEARGGPMVGHMGMAAGMGNAVMDAAAAHGQIRDRMPSPPASVPMPLAARKATGMAVNNAPIDAEAAAPHIRSYFPEALYINPEILTDGAGNADITLPMADSITTWHMAMLASTRAGALGTATGSLKVFQDFFVDLDLPVTLTQGDRVTLPVAVYNYAGQPGEVTLKLQPEGWLSLVDDVPTKSLNVQPNLVGASQFTLQANRIGKFRLTLSARMAGTANRQDVVVREIEVVPNGHEENLVVNGHLEPGAPARHTLTFPAAAIPDAGKLFVRLYPGPLSQVIEGMDGILRMPGGCFEQTSSSTYPNVLALDYMKRTKKLTPEVHAKAEGFIANGYQRLLTFEVPGGGFSWFGQAPANQILTAYGLMEFNDMSKVYDVDPRLLDRTRQWLADRQQPDGSWKPDTQFINEGATNRYNSDVLRITAYIAWSLANSGYHGPALDKARQYISTHLDAHADTHPDVYTLAVLANFAVDDAHDRDLTQRILQLLVDARTETADQVSWTDAAPHGPGSQGMARAPETAFHGTGSSAAIETTGLATQALLRWGQAPAVARKALAFLAATKQADGNWGTTQATIMALRALLLASESNGSDVRGTAQVLLNGAIVQTLQLTPDNNDLLHQFVLPITPGQPANTVEVRFSGAGSLAYQVAGRYFLPWPAASSSATTPSPADALAINVAYDRTHLAQNDIATATATIHNNLPHTANLIMVDLGIPPGFDLLSEDLQDLQEKSAHAHGGRLEKFSLTATQAILYFDALAPHQTLTLHFRLRAKYPIRAKTFQSRVYEYYDPTVAAVAAPVQMEVARH